ncbi:MAG: NRDE family protein [Verrucomicrobiota bacterium]
MCTVSFIPRRNGYAVAMNRDEKLARAAGLPPKVRTLRGRAVLCPSEPGGGTWIAVNDAGVTLALINWYSVKASVKRDAISRGEVVKGASAAGGPEDVISALSLLPLPAINPFRLIAVFSATLEISEWRWDLKRLVHRKHPWAPRQWISSGYDEPKAQQIRSAAFRFARSQSPELNLAWLRRLHSSHSPCCGPFSTCMHRADAATVSRTEITLCLRQATMRYQDGAPCQENPQHVRHLSLNFSHGSGMQARPRGRPRPVHR